MFIHQSTAPNVSVSITDAKLEQLAATIKNRSENPPQIFTFEELMKKEIELRPSQADPTDMLKSLSASLGVTVAVRSMDYNGYHEKPVPTDGDFRTVEICIRLLNRMANDEGLFKSIKERIQYWLEDVAEFKEEHEGGIAQIGISLSERGTVYWVKPDEYATEEEMSYLNDAWTFHNPFISRAQENGMPCMFEKLDEYSIEILHELLAQWRSMIIPPLNGGDANGY